MKMDYKSLQEKRKGSTDRSIDSGWIDRRRDRAWPWRSTGDRSQARSFSKGLLTVVFSSACFSSGCWTWGLLLATLRDLGSLGADCQPAADLATSDRSLAFRTSSLVLPLPKMLLCLEGSWGEAVLGAERGSKTSFGLALVFFCLGWCC